MKELKFSILFLILFAMPLLTVSAGTRQVAVTFDDLPSVLVPTHAEQLRVNQTILDILSKYQIRATGFVIGSEAFGRTEILNLWLERGHDLGNHTYSHMDFDQVDIHPFEVDIIKGAFEIEKLLAKHERYLRYFRFPYLHTGNNSEKGQSIRKFLEENCYTIAPVTIDPNDWEYNYQFVKAWGSNNKKKQELIEASYLRRVKNATEQAEILSWERFGRNIKQVLLLHLNRINAEVLDKILEYYSHSGYSFVPLEDALKDSAYSPEGELIESESSTWPLRPELRLFREHLK
jgi:peptidoglycan/xylan/chitin deacetylase (PgdA/CDA1 family)